MERGYGVVWLDYIFETLERPSDFNYSKRAAGRLPIDQISRLESAPRAARHVVDHIPKVLSLSVLDVGEKKSWFSNGRIHPSDSGNRDL